MPEPVWNIAGWRVPTTAAVTYLMRDYPRLTLLHYDSGGESPQDAITMADLGRATLFGAFRGWKTAARLLLASETAPWPTGQTRWRIDVAPRTDLIKWLSRKDVREARSLFSALASGDEGGWREAAASKVLHLKWPDFFPVIDGELRTLYADSAMKAERQIPGSRRRTRATTTAYWMAVRQDLLRPENADADTATRAALRAEPNQEKATLLTRLTRLRLLDSLAWAVSRGELAADRVAIA